MEERMVWLARPRLGMKIICCWLCLVVSASGYNLKKSFATWSKFPDPSKVYVDAQGRRRIDASMDLHAPDIPSVRKDNIRIGIATSLDDFSFRDNDFELLEFTQDTQEIFYRIRREGLCGSHCGSNRQFGIWDILDRLRSSTGDGTCAIDDLVSHFRSPFSRFPSLKGTYTFVLEAQGFDIRKGGPNAGVRSMGPIPVDDTTVFFHINRSRMSLEWLGMLPFFEILNVWVPLQKVNVRPLAVVDNAHRLRNASNDVVSICNSDAAATRTLSTKQKSNTTMAEDLWFLGWREEVDSSLDNPRIWMYDGLTPEFGLVYSSTRSAHSAVSLPGEDILEHYYNLLMFAKHNRSDIAELRKLCSRLEAETMPVYKDGEVSVQMLRLISRAEYITWSICKEGRVNPREIDEIVVDLTREALSFRVFCVVLRREWACAMITALSLALISGFRFFDDSMPEPRKP